MDAFDGKLKDWDEVKDAADWDALLVGNGLSINVWSKFDYASLFDQARMSQLFEASDEAVFSALGADNFEHVLHSLTDAIAIGEALGKRRPRERARHASIKAALAKAVKSVHVPGGLVPLETHWRIRDEMRMHRHVFSTSYDLLVYWAAAKGEDRSFEGFVDYFWAHDCNAFDENTITLTDEDRRTRLYFLHGALHLVVSGEHTLKRKASLQTLLSQFGQPNAGDDATTPLIITEGRAVEKERNIADNAYLAYCWKELRRCDAPLVVFGHSLSPQDAHLVAALNEHPQRPLAIGMRDRGANENRREMHRICSLLDAQERDFFDAATHPLGDPRLAIPCQPAEEQAMSR